MEKSSASKPQDSSDSVQKNGPEKRSLPSLASIFTRRPSQLETSLPMVNSSDDFQTNMMYPKFNEAQHVALCAVLLDEWVKELAALAQEHTIAQLTTLIN